MRIDSHIHLYDPAYGDYSWPAPGSEFYRVFSADMFQQAHGGLVDAAILVGCSGELPYNERVINEHANDKRIAGFIAHMNADEHLASNTKALSKIAKYRGFRIGSSDGLKDGAFGHIERALGEVDGVMELLGGWQDSWKYKDFFAKRPDRRFLIEHFGGYAFDGSPMPKAYDDFLNDLASLPNVYLKVSGLYTLCRVTPKPISPDFFREAFEAALHAFGEDRCLFGSDWPVLRAPYADAVAITGYVCDRHSAAARDKVMGANAMKFYSVKG